MEIVYIGISISLVGLLGIIYPYILVRRLLKKNNIQNTEKSAHASIILSMLVFLLGVINIWYLYLFCSEDPVRILFVHVPLTFCVISYMLSAGYVVLIDSILRKSKEKLKK